jgi:hypothetical protein
MSYDLLSYAAPNALIVSALKPLFPKDSDDNYPISHIEYPGNAEQFCIFQFSNRQPEVHSSGRNNSVIVYGYVDFFSISDESGQGKLNQQIEAALQEAGIVVSGVADVGKDNAGFYHTEFEIWIEVNRDG